jgi:putative alpha-1,2-mannosidase
MKLPNFKGYFVIKFSKPFADAGTYPSQPQPDVATGAFAKFHTIQGEVIEARIGTSFISLDQARKNLQAEIPGWNFTAVRQSLRSQWNAKLGEVSIEGVTEDQRHIFYTALYHSMLCPRTFSEHGRYYSAFDDKIHPGSSYTDYSMWDIFRAEFSLLTLVAPERIGGMTRDSCRTIRKAAGCPSGLTPPTPTS